MVLPAQSAAAALTMNRTGPTYHSDMRNAYMTVWLFCGLQIGLQIIIFFFPQVFFPRLIVWSQFPGAQDGKNRNSITPLYKREYFSSSNNSKIVFSLELHSPR